MVLSSSCRLAARSSVFALSLAMIAPVHASEAPAEAPPATDTDEDQKSRDEVIVTGTRSYEANGSNTATKLPLTLRETPQSITVITRQQIEDFNLNTIADVMAQTPGVTISSTDSNRITFNARGFAIQNFQLDGVPTVFQTGAYANSALSDIAIYERVEVVRGAAGLVTGTGDPSATVNLVRKRAPDEWRGYINLTGGSWDYYRVEGDVGGPIAADGRIRARVVGAYTDKHSYIDLQHDKSPALYGTIEADLTPTTTLRAGADYLRTKSEAGMWGAVPLYFTDGTPTHFKPSYTSSAPWAYWDRESTSVFGSIEQRFGSDWTARLSYNRRWTDTDSLVFASAGYPNPDGSGLGYSLYYGATEQTEDAFDAYVAGAVELFGRKHDVVFGANHYDRDFSVLYASATQPADWPTTIPNIFDWEGQFSEPGIQRSDDPQWIESTKETGVYGAVRLNPADGFKVILGARHTDYQTGTDYFSAAGDFTRTAANSKQKRTTPYGGVIVDLTDTVSAFASYAQVFKPQSVRDAANQQLDPVSGENFEAGFKAEFFDKRLYVSAAGFHMVQDNLSELDPDVPPNSLPDGSSAYRAISGAKTWGGEFEVAGEVLPGWSVQGGYTYARTENAAKDRIVTQFPLHIARFHTSYRLPGRWQGLTLGGGLSWQSEMYRTATIPTGAFNAGGAPVTRTGIVRQGNYALVDLMARYKVNDRVTLGANIINFFDKQYWRNVGLFSQGYFGEPRRAMANLRVGF